jgi:hypothetical protein
MKVSLHIKTVFLLQFQHSAPFASFAPHRITKYALSRKLPNVIAMAEFSSTKGVLL